MRRQLRLWLLVVLGMLAVSSAVGTALKAVIRPEPYDYRNAYTVQSQAQSLATRTGTTPAAFGPTQPPNAAETTVFLQLLDSLPGDRANHWMITQRFHGQRMAEELVPLHVYKSAKRNPPDPNLSLSRYAAMPTAAVEAVRGKPSPFEWVRTEILSVAMTPDRKDARLVAKHFDAGGRVSYRRWWLSSFGTAAWQIYDFDEPETRLRYLVRATGVEPAWAGLPGPLTTPPAGEWPVIAAMRASWLAASRGDLAGMDQRPWATAETAMIPMLATFRTLLAARRHILRNDLPAAVKLLATVDAGTNPEATLVGAISLNRQGMFAEALAAISRYRAALGDDPEAACEFARATAGLGKLDAALASLRAARKDFPDDARLFRAWYDLAPAERVLVGEALANCAEPGPSLFEFLRRLPSDDRDAAAVVKGFRTILKGDATGLSAEAALDARQNRDAGGALLREALSVTSGAKGREELLAQYVALAGPKHAAAAFRAAGVAGEQAAVQKLMLNANAFDVAFPALAAQATPSDPWSAGVLRAEKLFRAGDFASAATAAEALDGDAPWLLLARSYLRRGQAPPSTASAKVNAFFNAAYFAPDEAAAALDDYFAAGGTRAQLYGDPTLGPRLRSPAFTKYFAVVPER